MLAGGHEVLLDDALRVAEKARAAGVDVTLCVGRGMQHDFPLTLPWLDESREAWKRIVAFVDACVERAASSARGVAPAAPA